MNELKPCPFCGGKAEIRKGNNYGDPPHFYVVCTQCGIRGCTTCLLYDGDEKECLKKCEEKWNRRAVNV